MKKQQGFTLIELIAVLVILGILTAVAVPRFVNLSEGANQAATDAIAGTITSASALNYAADVAEDAGVTGTQPVTTAGATCAAAADLLLEGGVPSGYTVASTTVGANGVSTTCQVTKDGTTPAIVANATIIGATDN